MFYKILNVDVGSMLIKNTRYNNEFYETNFFALTSKTGRKQLQGLILSAYFEAEIPTQYTSIPTTTGGREAKFAELLQGTTFIKVGYGMLQNKRAYIIAGTEDNPGALHRGLFGFVYPKILSIAEKVNISKGVYVISRLFNSESILSPENVSQINNLRGEAHFAACRRDKLKYFVNKYTESFRQLEDQAQDGTTETQFRRWDVCYNCGARLGSNYCWCKTNAYDIRNIKFPITRLSDCSFALSAKSNAMLNPYFKLARLISTSMED